jgi:hypothetical protein
MLPARGVAGQLPSDLYEHSSLRVILGTSAFAHPGGTESYVLTVAHELRRLGHEAVVTALELGEMADLARRRGIVVAHDPSELPPGCDVLFAQDAIITGALAERYPNTRLVAFAHSDLFDHQLPVVLPGVVAAVVVASDRVAQRIQALPLDAPVVRLRHPIDTERFSPRGPIRERPRRALILSNYLKGDRRDALTGPWQAAGVECVQVGAPTQAELDVVPAIAEADIVVAKARAALEGMSCARAVYVFDEFGGDGWVTPDNYARLEADNFAGQVSPIPCDPERDLGGYRPDMGWTNRDLIRRHHTARRHVTELLEVLRGPGPQRDEPVGAVAEVARLARASWDAERRALTLEAEAVRLRERTIAAEWEAEEMRQRLDKAEAEAQAHAAEAEAWRGRALEAEPWRERAEEAERRVAELRGLLDTRRAQVGLAAGRFVDGLRRRR